MKNLYISLFFLMGIVSFGQSISGLDMKLSPNGVLENIFDQYGNKYTLSDINAGADTNVNNTMSRSTILCSSGIFDLYFETGSGMESTSDATQIQRRAVVCQVFTDISNFIISPLQNPGNTTRVKIWVRNINNISGAPSNVLGLATAFYNFPQNNTANFGGITDNEVWKTIISGKDSYINVTSPLVSTNPALGSSGNFYHGMMAFKFSGIAWNTNLTINSPAGQYDLYSIALHEITHALGFASLINENGQSVFGTGFNYFSRYDKFLKNNAGTQFLLTNGTACSSMYNYKFNTSLTTSILHPSTVCDTNHTDCETALKFVATSTVPVYTTNCFEQGSSLSHFEDLCVSPNINDAYFTMSNANGAGVTKRFLKFQERNTLGDIGYKLNTTYGNNTAVFGSYYNYGGLVTRGISVAGINDGLNTNGTYSYIYNPGSPAISINDILLNDKNATSFECVEDVTAASTITVTSGIINFSSSISGVHLLRYVPTNGSQKGNITYIYVYVNENNNCGIPNSCNLVTNGDFELHSTLSNVSHNNANNVCNWSQGNNHNSIYFSGDIPYSPGLNDTVPCHWAGYETDNISGNKGYLRMNIISNSTYPIISSTIKTKLTSSLLPNKTYQLSFDYSLGEAESNFTAKIQAYLSTTFVSYPGNGAIPISNPNMLKTSTFFPNQTNGWQKIVLNFTTTSGGENTLYLGALSEASSLLNTPSPQNLFGCNYGSYNNPSTSYYGSGYFIDNVKLIALNDGAINLPSTICSNQTLSNLESHLSAIQPNGVFTGNGVINNNGIYSFNAATAGIGIKTITYSYINNLECLVNVHSQITVSDCSSSSCPGNLIFNTIEPATLATYQAANTIITNTNYIVNAGSSISLVAGNSITFSPSSEVKASATSNFTASLAPCVQTSARIIEEEIVKEKIIEDTVSLFPNPTNEIITISTKTSDLKRITICSIEGKIVFSQSIEKNNLYQLNVANYQNGIYLAIIETHDGKIYKEKIIKN
jgi:hypothetical protein